jgi:hypothetical protein
MKWACSSRRQEIHTKFLWGNVLKNGHFKCRDWGKGTNLIFIKMTAEIGSGSGPMAGCQQK